MGRESKIKGVTKKYIRTNKQGSLGPERYLYKVGTSPPHDSYTPYELVDRKTTTRV